MTERPTPALEVSDSQAGAVISVLAMPRASRSGVAGVREGRLLVRLHAAPADGAANAELLEVLARALGVPKRDLEIISGESTRTKRVRIAGMSASAALQSLGI